MPQKKENSGRNFPRSGKMEASKHDASFNGDKFSNSGLLTEIIDLFPNLFYWTQTIDGESESVYYSSNIINVTGYLGDEIQSMPGRGLSLVVDEDLSPVKNHLNNFTNDASRNFTELVYRIRKRDDVVIWLKENIAVTRSKEGKIESYFGIVENISSLKEADQSLQKSSEELKQLNASKDKFISILSHDLRSPFTSILGFSEILMNEPDLSVAERHEYLNYIHESSQTQLQLINYLLDWSRLQTGRIKIEPQRLNAQTLIYNCVSSLTGNAIRKNIDIKVEVRESIFIQADERLVNQVFTNILSNAIKFSNEGEKVEIFADVFNDDKIEFIFKDKGIGISESNKIKMFSVEKMFSTEGTKGEKGTGLGLPLVKEIINKHNCEIWFYSEAGKGSEFHFTLPLSHNTILLIEDDETQLSLIEKAIKDEYPSFRLVTAINGYEAMSIILDRLPSLIITSHDMPLMTGLELIESLKKGDKNFRIPVIASVQLITDELRKSYQELGVSAILQKPVDINLLTQKLQLILEY
jgi:PAS domain S-box-containing protein